MDCIFYGLEFLGLGLVYFSIWICFGMRWFFGVGYLVVRIRVGIFLLVYLVIHITYIPSLMMLDYTHSTNSNTSQSETQAVDTSISILNSN